MPCRGEDRNRPERVLSGETSSGLYTLARDGGVGGGLSLHHLTGRLEGQLQGRVFYMEFPSTDVDRATRFWNGVMGWNFGSGLFKKYDYRMAQIASDAAVAVCRRRGTGDRTSTSRRPTWSRAEAALVRVKELGGAVGEIRTVPDPIAAEFPSAAIHGRFAGCKDSEGNMFHLWQRNAELDPGGGAIAALTRIGSTPTRPVCASSAAPSPDASTGIVL